MCELIVTDSEYPDSPLMYEISKPGDFVRKLNTQLYSTYIYKFVENHIYYYTKHKVAMYV